MRRSRTPSLLLAALLLVVAAASDARGTRAPRHAPAVTMAVHGRVFEDRNADGAQDGGEPGVAGAAVLLVDAEGAVRGEATTDAAGDYALPADDTARTIVCVPAPGSRPVGAASRPRVAGRAADFGVAMYVPLDLAHAAPRCLAAGRLRETRGAGGDDVDLVAGGDAAGTDALAAWFNQYDRLPLFARRPDDGRTAPNTVLAVAFAPLAGGGVEVVTGTRRAVAGNLFSWRTLRTPGSAGHLPATYTQACRTRDDGDVRALAALPDGALLAGTAAPDGARGTIERWQRDTDGLWTCAARDTAAGGAVVAIATRAGGGLAVVATAGALYAIDPARLGAADAVRWRAAAAGAPVRAIAAADVTGDGAPDLLVARGDGGDGALELWRNDSAAGVTAFTRVRVAPLPAAPTALATGEFGGGPGADVAVGLATGGVRVFWCDGGTLPPRGGDAARRIDGAVTALAAGDLDPAGGMGGDDLVVASRAAGRTGAIRVLVRGPAGAPLGAAIGR